MPLFKKRSEPVRTPPPPAPPAAEATAVEAAAPSTSGRNQAPGSGDPASAGTAGISGPLAAHLAYAFPEFWAFLAEDAADLVSNWRESGEVETAEDGALLYAVLCADVVRTVNATVKVANTTINALELSMQGHENSRQTFRRKAAQEEKKFVENYREFDEACSSARAAAAAFRAIPSTDDVELVLNENVDPAVYAMTETAGHILRGTFPPTPQGFADGLSAANVAIRSDVYYFGDEGFIGHVYSPQGSGEMACPWCAETIKEAAKICRFCNREIAPPRNSI